MTDKKYTFTSIEADMFKGLWRCAITRSGEHMASFRLAHDADTDLYLKSDVALELEALETRTGNPVCLVHWGKLPSGLMFKSIDMFRLAICNYFGHDQWDQIGAIHAHSYYRLTVGDKYKDNEKDDLFGHERALRMAQLLSGMSESVLEGRSCKELEEVFQYLSEPRCLDRIYYGPHAGEKFDELPKRYLEGLIRQSNGGVSLPIDLKETLTYWSNRK